MIENGKYISIHLFIHQSKAKSPTDGKDLLAAVNMGSTAVVQFVVRSASEFIFAQLRIGYK